jgi:hypothetical protein
VTADGLPNVTGKNPGLLERMQDAMEVVLIEKYCISTALFTRMHYAKLFST